MERVQILAGLSPKSRTLAKAVANSLRSDFKIVRTKPDLYVVIGGDGTLLHWLRNLDYPAQPFLGVDAGSLGFFQEVTVRELPKLAKLLKSGRYSLQELPLLELKNDRKVLGYAFNEFAVERASARATNLRLSIGGHKFERFIGDGLIIATPQGSTAYAGAAGGAILPYDLDLFEVVPSNPHQSALYHALRQPLILSSSNKLDIEVLDPKSRPVRVVADGQEVNVGPRFTIGINNRRVTMLRTHKFNLYKRLSSKLIG